MFGLASSGRADLFCMHEPKTEGVPVRYVDTTYLYISDSDRSRPENSWLPRIVLTMIITMVALPYIF
jgi:hypothetical protein